MRVTTTAHSTHLSDLTVDEHPRDDDQFDCVRTAPGKLIAMTPPHAQLQVDEAVRAGLPPIMVFAAPGFQGVVTGMQGIGVSTPRAAVVAAATVGFDNVVHMPKGGMFTIGAASVIVAAGLPSIITREIGRGERVAGATPNEHINMAVWVTLGGMKKGYRA